MQATSDPVDRNYLTITARAFASIKTYSYRAMKLKRGNSVLDVGCGIGVDTISLAKEVEEAGRVVGVDLNPTMVSQANHEVKTLKINHFVQHQVAKADALPFSSNTFDACRSERLFQHLEDPEKVLSEMLRILKPSGRIVVVDTDWASMSIDTEYIETERKLKNYRLDQFITNAYAARSLFRLFKLQNVHHIQEKIFPIIIHDHQSLRDIGYMDHIESGALNENIITENECSRWKSSLKQASQEGLLFCSGNIIAVSGIKV